MQSVGVLVNGLETTVRYSSVEIVVIIEDNVRKASVYVWKGGKGTIVSQGMSSMEKSNRVG